MGVLELYPRKGQRGYNPCWQEFTQRQKRIIRGYETDNVRLRELSAIIYKAEELRMPLIVDIVTEMYEAAVECKYQPKYTIEEAQAVLQQLTPWKRG